MSWCSAWPAGSSGQPLRKGLERRRALRSVLRLARMRDRSCPNLVRACYWLLGIYCLALACCSGCCHVDVGDWGLGVRDSGPMATRRAGVIELPVVNLMRALREWNWGGGSCVHASNVMGLRWANLLDVAAWWRKTYSGGESYNGLTSKLRKAKIPFYATADGEVDVLDRCTAERRGAVIFYYTNHSILFCGFSPDNQYAYVLDNNRIEEFIKIPRATFIKNWRGFGGVAIVPTAGFPPPPLPFVKK